jgi:hypothetical protein
MRTETITRTLYSINELSEDAQQKAHEAWAAAADYPWAEDNRRSLEAFCKIFPVNAKSWEYGYRDSITGRYERIESQEVADLTGFRLQRYVFNNYYHQITEPKIYYRNGKKRRSRIFKQPTELTGYCIDYDITAPIFEFLRSRKPSGTLEDLLNDCLNAWLSAVSKDYEACFSFEYFKDHAKANKYEYDEDGEQV